MLKLAKIDGVRMGFVKGLNGPVMVLNCSYGRRKLIVALEEASAQRLFGFLHVALDEDVKGKEVCLRMQGETPKLIGVSDGKLETELHFVMYD